MLQKLGDRAYMEESLRSLSGTTLLIALTVGLFLFLRRSLQFPNYALDIDSPYIERLLGHRVEALLHFSVIPQQRR
jgi:hypothetical protein